MVKRNWEVLFFKHIALILFYFIIVGLGYLAESGHWLTKPLLTSLTGGLILLFGRYGNA